MTIRIALCGLGSAGRSRLKALTAHVGFELAGVVSRRPELSTLLWHDALMDPSVDAIAVSTENTLHAQRVREGLKAGKHVLCDYPLAFSEQEAKDLIEFARSQKRILHIEHIGLLTESHQKARQDILRLGQPVSGTYRFTGDWTPKIADEKKSGPLPFLACSRLLQIADWFGDFEAEHSEFQSDEKGLLLRFHLKFTQGGTWEFVEERRPGLERQRRMEFRSKVGVYVWEPVAEPPGLFAKDLEWFRKRILENHPAYYSEPLMLKVLKTLESVASSR